MGNRILNGTNAGNTGKSFTGSRQPVHPMPIPLRSMVRQWCYLNGVFMSEDGTYITWNSLSIDTDWNEQDEGKSKIIKLYLNYHKTQDGREFVIARNNRINKRVNITGLMAVEHHIQNLSFDGEMMDMLNSNLLNHAK